MSVGTLYTKDEIKPTDILLGKGKVNTHHIGTIAFKALIDVHVKLYMDDATASCQKTFMTVEMVDKIHAQGGRFLKETTNGSGQWIEIGKGVARERVRDSFRDSVKRLKKQRPNAFLNKINLSVQFNSTQTFMDILHLVHQDPAVHRFLKLSKGAVRKKQRKGKIIAASGKPVGKQPLALLSPRTSFQSASLRPILFDPNLSPATGGGLSTRQGPSLSTVPLIPATPVSATSSSSVVPVTRPALPPNPSCCSDYNLTPREFCMLPILKSLDDDNTPYDPWMAESFHDIEGIDLLSALEESERVLDATYGDLQDNQLAIPDDDGLSEAEWLDSLDGFDADVDVEALFVGFV